MFLKSSQVMGLSFLGLMQTSCILLLLFSTTPFLSGIFWYLDLFTHFRFQYLISSSIFLIGFIILKKKLYVVMAAMVMIINSAFVLQLYTQEPSTTDVLNKKHIKLFHANVLTSNNKYEKLDKQIAIENPDVILLQEVDTLWMTHLNTIKSQYKHNVQVPRSDNFGMALFSRIPITDYKILDWSNVEVPSIMAEFDLQGVTFNIIATHPPPPINEQFHNARTSIFESIAKVVNDNKQATVVMGDLNTTVWSSSYQALESHTGLINASNGFGFMPSWPTNLMPLMIPIDHCLISKHFKVIDIKTGNPVGSDHLPLVVELKL